MNRPVMIKILVASAIFVVLLSVLPLSMRIWQSTPSTNLRDQAGTDQIERAALENRTYAAILMQQFIEELSAWARQRKPGFIILPQNGPELAFEGGDSRAPLRSSYLAAVDGFAAEEVFYFGQPRVSAERLEVLRRLRAYKPVLISEYVGDEKLIQEAMERGYSESFITFVRAPNNYDYIHIPKTVPFRNGDSIQNLSQVRNFLYLINPERYPIKDAFLQALEATEFDLIIIDAQFQGEWLSASDVSRLQRKPSGERRLVLAYINIGAAEKWRYYWQPTWGVGNPDWLLRPYPGYPDEVYVAYWRDEWKDIIFRREGSYLAHILEAGFDGAFLDNVEAYIYIRG
ncbi:MAG: endo alpha-1,4 polygalactosaminidase [Nitrososphaerota archaeon]